MTDRIDYRPMMIARELNADQTLTEKQRDALYEMRVAALKDSQRFCQGCDQPLDRSLDTCPNCEVSRTVRCLDCDMPKDSMLHGQHSVCNINSLRCYSAAEHHEFV